MATRTIQCQGQYQQVTASDSPPTRLTDSEQGKKIFLVEAAKISGVVEIGQSGGESLVDQSLLVYVRDGDVQSEYAVYELKGRVYRQFPNARLEVTVLQESDLGSAAHADG